MDANNDGEITKNELKDLIYNLGEDFSDEVIDEIIKKADVNVNGKLDFNEFLYAATE